MRDKDIDKLITENEQFILRCASKTTGRFITKSDDEWSIALIAFSEAVRSFEESKGELLPFAAMIIRRRLIDNIRSEAKHRGETPVEPYALDGEINDGSADMGLQEEVLKKHYENESGSAGERIRARDEIESANERLGRYGFSFFDLAEVSPKAEKTKASCAKVVRLLLASDDAFEKMRRGKKLPIKNLAAGSGVSRKIIDRHRRYIIAAAEILRGDYPVLAGYLDYIRKGSDT